MSLSKKILAYGLMVLFVGLWLEIISYFGQQHLAKKGIIYIPSGHLSTNLYGTV